MAFQRSHQHLLHQAHDYLALMTRWREVAQKSNLTMIPLCEVDLFALFAFSSGQPTATHRVYLSAGIHGDEPAGTEGLLRWAQKNSPLFARRDLFFMILPCLNPWGLTNNSRLDSHGHDLNRLFLPGAPEPIPSIQKLVKGLSFHLAVMLHEDYDARGLYLYEIETRNQPLWGEKLIRAAWPIIPPDDRSIIEGRSVNSRGVIRRKITSKIRRIGAEAIFLRKLHSKRAFTLETPSEDTLEARVQTHEVLLNKMLSLLLKEKRGPK